MAKLSARGRTEVVRFSKENSNIPSDRSIEWERTTVAIMSDGHLLEKWDVRFKPGTLRRETEFHSYGWKDKGKVKATKEQLVAYYLKRGWTQV